MSKKYNVPFVIHFLVIVTLLRDVVVMGVLYYNSDCLVDGFWQLIPIIWRRQENIFVLPCLNYSTLAEGHLIVFILLAFILRIINKTC